MAHRSILLAAAVALSLTGLCGRPAHADTPEAVEVRSEQSTVRVVAFFFDAAADPFLAPASSSSSTGRFCR